LIIVGDGPLRGRSRALIEQFGLAAAVCLAGSRANPFPLMRAADCFVLSSNHEGQPMVLLEAMVLNCPVVATDIEGNRSALMGSGFIVPNDVAGLRDGMISAMEGDIAAVSFDATAYQASAASRFEAMIG
jgi:CDP-glycerol glycerophosphotransferase